MTHMPKFHYTPRSILEGLRPLLGFKNLTNETHKIQALAWEQVAMRASLDIIPDGTSFDLKKKAAVAACDHLLEATTWDDADDRSAQVYEEFARLSSAFNTRDLPAFEGRAGKSIQANALDVLVGPWGYDAVCKIDSYIDRAALKSLKSDGFEPPLVTRVYIDKVFGSSYSNSGGSSASQSFLDAGLALGMLYTVEGFWTHINAYRDSPSAKNVMGQLIGTMTDEEIAKYDVKIVNRGGKEIKRKHGPNDIFVVFTDRFFEAVTAKSELCARWGGEHYDKAGFAKSRFVARIGSLSRQRSVLLGLGITVGVSIAGSALSDVTAANWHADACASPTHILTVLDPDESFPETYVTAGGVSGNKGGGVVLYSTHLHAKFDLNLHPEMFLTNITAGGVSSNKGGGVVLNNEYLAGLPQTNPGFEGAAINADVCAPSAMKNLVFAGQWAETPPWFGAHTPNDVDAYDQDTVAAGYAELAEDRSGQALKFSPLGKGWVANLAVHAPAGALSSGHTANMAFAEVYARLDAGGIQYANLWTTHATPQKAAHWTTAPATDDSKTVRFYPEIVR